MADDTRKSSVAIGDTPRPKPPANIMPGGTAHTAGGEKADAAGPGYFEVVRQLGPDYYLNFHKRPCVRDSQLQAIPAGVAGGSLAFIIRKPVWIATNWAVATWCGVSCISYQVCQYYRSKEKAGMRQAQELMKLKREKIEAKKEARRKAREEHDRAEELKRQEEKRSRSWSHWYKKNVKFW